VVTYTIKARKNTDEKKFTTNEKKRKKTERKKEHKTEDRRQEKGKEEEINRIQPVIETEPRNRIRRP
jgi:hypothetical protein